MKPAGPITRAWYKWKSLHLPWRKRYLVGFDLQGNTYWVFRLTNQDSSRWRRIVKYPRSTHLSSVKVNPLWHQWLRYTRDEPPTLEEQQGDVVRQARMKTLAAEADARWEAKPRLVDAPGQDRGQPVPALESAAEKEKERTRHGEGGNAKAEGEKEDPWAKHRSTGPGEQWQPQGWTPTSGRKQ